MTMHSSLHTSDMTNKHSLEVKFKDWPSGTFPRSSYITLEFGQMNEGEMTLFARHSMYGDLIAGLEDAARQLREVVAKEMVQTSGFPICARADLEALLRENGEAVRRTGNELMQEARDRQWAMTREGHGPLGFPDLSCCWSSRKGTG